MKIAFTNDHAAVEAREQIIRKLRELGHEVIDLGAKSPESVDYPNYAAAAARAVAAGEADRAVLVCGTGIGMSIVANKFRGVRCAVATDTYAAEMSRRHNDANCLALRAREQSPETNEQILDVWLKTEFEGGRHERRVKLIQDFENPEARRASSTDKENK